MNIEFQCTCGYWIKLNSEFPTVRCVGCNQTYAAGDSFDSSEPGFDVGDLGDPNEGEER